MERWAYLIGAGIVGILARYVLMVTINAKFGPDFPYGTLVVNLIGCFLVGLFDTICDAKLAMSNLMRITLIAGFCGSFTTFSAMMLDINNLLKVGDILKTFIYILLSLIIGFVLFRLGVLLGKII